ncbi:chemotaxis protein CheB [Paraburkholderia mimosarum]|uniref:chemotaxis protein CheB n=1 Tax=Paraburkholderia mimosarum TaxID=312026 RepID=UPI000685DCA6|nr:chemotaxis protein CheB [Paraburkholderia mimosarum]
MTGRIIVIGASYGGIEALSLLVGQLPPTFPAPVFIVQHLGAGSLGVLPRILSRAGSLPVAHPRHCEPIRPGRIYVAPPDHHMLVRKGYVALSLGPRENRFRPAVDPLFRSAALAYGPAVVGVILTGHLDDGTAGLMAIKDQRGTAVVQEPREATAPSMHASALANVTVDHRCSVAEMGALLVMLANDDASMPALGLRDELDTEVRIAEGDLDQVTWARFEAMAAPCGLNCPDCEGALFMLRDQRVARFRCRAGHAFSAQSLLCARRESIESKLGMVLGALSEEAALARLLLKTPSAQAADCQTALHAEIHATEQRAAQVSEWLRGPSETDSKYGLASTRLLSAIAAQNTAP